VEADNILFSLFVLYVVVIQELSSELFLDQDKYRQISYYGWSLKNIRLYYPMIMYYLNVSSLFDSSLAVLA